mmetsp:Transcript_5140/g.16546  ORF Transcript_5140/g.16546 Transcript_5140/m.16546 type:complete len:448 (-) Transcript_5140:431-1774(-)
MLILLLLLSLCSSLPTEVELAVKKCGGEKACGVVLQLTDIHLDTLYRPGSLATCLQYREISYPCCNGGIPIPAGGIKKRSAGTWGDYWCDTPMTLLNRTIAELARFGVQGLDAVLWTGDSPGHNDFSQTESRNVASILAVTDAFSSIFDGPGIPIIPALGNHGAFPVDNLRDAPHNQWLIGPLLSAWQRYLPPSQLATFNQSGYFEVPLPGMATTTIALVLSTTYFDRHNYLPHSNGEHAQLKWLTARLAAARAASERVYLVGHIFPGDGEANDLYTETYLQLAAEYADIIVHHVYGHAHTDRFQLLEAPQGGPPTGVAYITPSVTPFGKVNPSFRYFVVNRSTSLFVDYLDYALDLTQANALPSGTLPTYSFYYQASVNLSLADQSVASYQTLVDRLASDEEFFTYFYQDIYHVGATAALADIDACTEACRRSFICKLNQTRHSTC